MMLIDAMPVVAATRGWLIALGVVLFFALGAYAIWWLVFRMGKD